MNSQADLKKQIEAIQKDMAQKLAGITSAEEKFCAVVGAEIERTAKELMRGTEINPNVTYTRG